MKQSFDSANGFGSEEDIAANTAHLRRNVVNDDHLAPVHDRVDHGASFVLARASPDRALHMRDSALPLLIDNLGPGGWGELEERGGKRDIPFDTLETELHHAAVGIEDH